jgi:hypothetical protein
MGGLERTRKVPSVGFIPLLCLVLGATPLALDAFGGLGDAWPRESLPAGLSRTALALLPWIFCMGLPLVKGGRRSALDCAVGLPVFGLAIASDAAAGLALQDLLFCAGSGVLMLVGLARGARVASKSSSGQPYGFAWLLLVLGPVAIALAFGFSESGAPLSPDEAGRWLQYSPVGWCLTWAAENPGLEPRLASAPYAALLVTAALVLLPSLASRSSVAGGEDS